MRIKSQRDFLSGLLFMGMGVVFALGAGARDLGSLAQPGAGFFALGLGLTLAALGLAVWFKSMTIETEHGDPLDPIAWRALLCVVGAAALFGWAVPRWGVVGGVSLAAVLLALARSGASWREVLALALTAVAAGALIVGLGPTAALPWWPLPHAG